MTVFPPTSTPFVPSTPAERSACGPRFFKRGDWPAYVCLKISSGCRTHSDCCLHGARGKVKQAAKWRLAVSRIQTGIVSRRKAVGLPPPSAQGVHSHSRRGTRRIATSRDSRAGEPESAKIYFGLGQHEAGLRLQRCDDSRKIDLGPHRSMGGSALGLLPRKLDQQAAAGSTRSGSRPDVRAQLDGRHSSHRDAGGHRVGQTFRDPEQAAHGVLGSSDRLRTATRELRRAWQPRRSTGQRADDQ